MPEENNKSKYTNMESNIAAALSYLVAPLTGIALFIVEKEDKFVRFHAFQSILFGVVSYAIWAIATSMVAIFIGVLLLPLVSLAIVGFYIYLMWKAYNGESYEMPVLGKIAKDQVYKK